MRMRNVVLLLLLLLKPLFSIEKRSIKNPTLGDITPSYRIHTRRPIYMTIKINKKLRKNKKINNMHETHASHLSVSQK